MWKICYTIAALEWLLIYFAEAALALLASVGLYWREIIHVMKKTIKAIAVLLCGITMHAMAMSSDWGTLSLEEYGSDLDGHVLYALRNIEFCFIPMSGTILPDNLSLSFNDGGYMEFSNAMVLSVFGVVNDAAYMSGQSSYLYLSDSYYGDPSSSNYRTDAPLVISKGESAYVAIAGRNVLYTDEILYGWAKLSVDQDGLLHMDNSVLAPLGITPIVGQLPIPEPSGGMLLLIGAVVLGLRRVKRLKD